jgi:hypothetical protein
MAAKPRRGKMEGFQRINMIGFTERLERFRRARGVGSTGERLVYWRGEIVDGGGGGSVVVVDELGLKVGSRWLGELGD